MWVRSCSTAPARKVSQAAMRTLKPFSMSQNEICRWQQIKKPPKKTKPVSSHSPTSALVPESQEDRVLLWPGWWTSRHR